MKIFLTFTFTMLYLIGFFLIKKRLSVFENLFIFIFMVFMFSSYTAVLEMNLNFWGVKEDAVSLYIYLSFVMVVAPLLFVTFINWMLSAGNLSIKVLYVMLLLVLLVGIETILVYWNVITYKSWKVWYSVISDFIVFLISCGGWRCYRLILEKEVVST